MNSKKPNDIAQLYGKHKDETIVVIGNSSSLNEMDLTLLDSFTTIGLNRILRAYEPIYLMVVDTSVIYVEAPRMNDSESIKLIYPGAMNSRARSMYTGAWISTGPMTELCDPTALNGPIHIGKGGGNSAYEAVQIAHRMGAKRIALAGVDMYYPPMKPSHMFGDGSKEGCKLPEPDKKIADFGALKKMFAMIGVDMFSISPWKTKFREVMGYVPAEDL